MPQIIPVEKPLRFTCPDCGETDNFSVQIPIFGQFTEEGFVIDADPISIAYSHGNISKYLGCFCDACHWQGELRETEGYSDET